MLLFSTLTSSMRMKKYDLKWLIERFNTGEKIKYMFFWGHLNKTGAETGKFVFSQWFPSSFTVEGVTYPTSEHWMMVQKAKLFGDNTIAEKILQTEKPGEAKDLGRQIVAFDAVIWDREKFRIVVEGNIHKFRQNHTAKDYLLATGDRVLVEASPVDIVWGIGLTHDSATIEDPTTWRGENLLGFALMEARGFLREESGD